MTPEIVWRRSAARGGWECYLGDRYFGIVYTNGEAWIGNRQDMSPRGSPYLRARELERYIKAGGQP
jgi:hypothetical protein